MKKIKFNDNLKVQKKLISVVLKSILNLPDKELIEFDSLIHDELCKRGVMNV